MVWLGGVPTAQCLEFCQKSAQLLRGALGSVGGTGCRNHLRSGNKMAVTMLLAAVLNGQPALAPISWEMDGEKLA